MFGLVAHMGGMHGAGRRQRRGEFDDFVRWGRIGRWIEQPRAHPDGASLQRVLEPGPHPGDLARGGRPVQPVHDPHPQGGVTDLGHDIDGGRFAVERVEVVREPREIVLGPVADQV